MANINGKLKADLFHDGSDLALHLKRELERQLADRGYMLAEHETEGAPRLRYKEKDYEGAELYALIRLFRAS